MKKITVITLIIGIVVGSCITLTYLAMRSTMALADSVNKQGQAIVEITNFINKSIEAQKATK